MSATAQFTGEDARIRTGILRFVISDAIHYTTSPSVRYAIMSGAF